jgi:acetyltransferase-like isoleucine patch superfamily enzyme
MGLTDHSIMAEDLVLADQPVLGPYCVMGIDGPRESRPLSIGREATIRSHTVLYRGTTIGEHFHAGHGVLVREHTTIGDYVSVGSHSVIEHHVTIGHRVRLHSGCFVPEHSVLEDGAWLGPRVTVTNARYPNRSDTKDRLEGVHVERDATVGAGVILLPGVRVGAGALIGAGTVVVNDVDPGATIVGNPGRRIR